MFAWGGFYCTRCAELRKPPCGGGKVEWKTRGGRCDCCVCWRSREKEDGARGSVSDVAGCALGRKKPTEQVLNLFRGLGSTFVKSVRGSESAVTVMAEATATEIAAEFTTVAAATAAGRGGGVSTLIDGDRDVVGVAAGRGGA